MRKEPGAEPTTTPSISTLEAAGALMVTSISSPAAAAAASPDAAHGVDVSATFDAGVASLRAHAAYLDGLGWEDFDPAAFLASMSAPTGERMGVTHAVAFEVRRMGWDD